MNLPETELTTCEAIDRLDYLSDGDKEIAHQMADEIIMAALRFNELRELAEAWEAARSRIGFWYA